MASLSELYIAWNNAMVDYFITTSSSTVFYVTDSKIEDIGLKSSIEKGEDETYKECFVRSISFFIEKGTNARANLKGRICYETLKNDLFSKLHIKDSLAISGNNSEDSILTKEFGDNKSSILDLAVFLSNYTILTDLHSKSELPYPYFSYVIFVLLGFNSSENREWKGVEEIFKSNNIYFCNKDREKVAYLFGQLIDNHILTPSCVQTQDPYIKYLKYHAVLKPSDKNLFDEILYTHHIQWNNKLAYGDLRDLIWRVGIRNTQQYSKLREALIDVATRPYFESLIKNFDREVYALNVLNGTDSNNKIPLVKGHFRYVIDRASRSSQIWLQYIKPECAVTNGEITLTPIHTYADNYRVDLLGEITWKEYTSQGVLYKDSRYHVSSTVSNFYFFEIVEGRWLAEMIEPEQLTDKPCILIIKSDMRDKQTIVSYQNAQLINIAQLPCFDSNWEAYYIPKYVPKHAEANIPITQASQQLKYVQICLDDCLTYNRKVYLTEAFPYIITEGIESLADVNITITDIDGKNVSYKKKVAGKRIYLYDIEVVSCGEIEITISADGIEDMHSYRVISNLQVPPVANKVCAKFDKWGCLNNDLQSNFYSDNEVTPLKSKSTNCLQYLPGFKKEKKQPYHRLMSILYSLGNSTAHNCTFSSRDLDNVINYLADFEGDNLSEVEIKRLKYALRDLGILTHYYINGQYLYETNTPRLVPLGEGRGIFEGVSLTKYRDLYLLYGSYSQLMYEELYETVDHFEYKPVELSPKLSKYIPPYIIVGLCRDQRLESIQISNSSPFDNLMNFTGKISELEQDTNVFTKYNYEDNHSYSYPVMVPSNRDRGRKELLRLSENEVVDNSNLSPDLLNTYIRYKHNKPIWYVDKERSHNSELFFRSDWQLPFYVRKALVADNYALPKYTYVFGMNGTFGKDRLFYKMFMYKCNHTEKLKEALGGGTVCCFDSSTISNIGLQMYATKFTENGLVNWQMKLYMDDKLICYTRDERVFYDYNGNYVEIISDASGYNTVNDKLSAILNLYIHCINSRFPINEWVKNYISINKSSTDTPYFGTIEKFAVKIIKPIENKYQQYAKE